MDAGARIVLMGKLDGFANSQKINNIRRHLESRGHDVTLINTYALSRASDDATSIGRLLPAPRPVRLLLFLAEWVQKLAGKNAWARRHLSYRCIVVENRLRRHILGRVLRGLPADLVIAAGAQDAEALLDVDDATTWYDCQTPWADELYDEERLTPRQHTRMREREGHLFESVDHLSFTWRTYGWYAVEQYGISGKNLETLDTGCEPGRPRVKHSDPPRIVYLGLLSMRFINLPMLSRLSRLYPHIDVYGGPEPDPELGLNYLGYADPSILGEYQLGLITCTDDELRRQGMSGKHLDYLSVGLPVLVPRWRRRLDLLEGSVPYDETDFLDIVESFRDPAHWQQVSDIAYEQAQRLAWDNTLRPLDDVLATIPRA